MRTILLAGAAALALAGSWSIASAQPDYGNIPAYVMQSDGILNAHDLRAANRSATYASEGRLISENEEPSSAASFHFLGASGAVP